MRVVQHNVKRVPHSQEAIQARKEREKSQIAEYLALTNNVLSRVGFSFPSLGISQSVPQKKARDWSRDAFDQTQQLLELNPEFYTVWNYRRNIMLNGIFPQRSVAFAYIAHRYVIRFSVPPKRTTIYWRMS